MFHLERRVKSLQITGSAVIFRACKSVLKILKLLLNNTVSIFPLIFLFTKIKTLYKRIDLALMLD